MDLQLFTVKQFATVCRFAVRFSLCIRFCVKGLVPGVMLAFFLLLSGLVSISGGSPLAWAGNPGQPELPPDIAIKITKEELMKTVSENLSRVEEFRFIKEEADRLGVKVYLFGGTAAAYGHYAKWDLLRKKGDKRYHPARFDYKYINIYRSTQDLDIVVDGSVEKIHSLESAIVENFPYMQGSKGTKKSWEVRSLHEDMGDKLALLNNPDFLNQHTDSQSVGLIEITEPRNPWERIRDLREWENLENSGFLNDLLEGKIHYYFSNLHETTKFFQEGRNPPILSVIRYFIKVFQLDLTMREEDRAVIANIINHFDPTILNKHTYLPHWFEDNAPKLVQNAIDVESAMKMLSQVGLRSQLLKIGRPQEIGTVAWWMNKQPLESKPLGRGLGRTAKELNIDIIAHETTSFLVYEAITRSHKLLPNVLISRQGYEGEAAVHGDGFYAMIGDRSGFRGTGFTIRFRVKPEARIKTDFDVFQSYIVVHNREAIEVIPENITMGLLDYYDWLLSGPQISKDDLGIYQRLRLAMRASLANPSKEDLKQLAQFTTTDLKKIMSVDPSMESKFLILELLVPRLQRPQEVLDLYRSVNETNKTLRANEAEKVSKQLSQNWGPQLLKIFLSQKRPMNELIEAFELGAFDGKEDLYLEQVLPHLHSIREIQTMWEAWGRRTLSTYGNKYPKSIRPLVLKLVKKFLALNPNSDQISKLSSVTPEVKIAIYCLEFKDPVLFAQLLNELKLVNSGKNVKAVWMAKKQEFFALSPSILEMLDIFKLRLPIVVEVDLLDYVLETFTFRRATDLHQLFAALQKQALSVQDAQLGDRYQRSLEKLMDLYLDKTPAIMDVAKVLRLSVFSPELQAVFLQRLLDQGVSLDDLIALAGEPELFRGLSMTLAKNPEKLKALPSTSKAVEEFAKQMKYSEAAYVVFKRYMETHPDDLGVAVELLATDLIKVARLDVEFIEPLWLRTMDWYWQAFPKKRRLDQFKESVPTVRTYRILMERLLNEATLVRETINDLLAFQKILGRTFSRDEIRQTHEINNELVPMAIQRIAGTAREFFDTSNCVEFSYHLTSPIALFKIMDSLVKAGMKFEGGFHGAEWFGNNLQKEHMIQFWELVALYEVVKREEIADPARGTTYYTPLEVVANLSSNVMVQRLNLATEKDFVLAVHKYYLLRQLKSLVGGANYTRGVTTLQREVDYVFAAKDYISSAASPFATEILAQNENLRDKYKLYPMAVWKESGSLIGKTWSLVTLAKARSHYESEIDKEVAEADRLITETLRRLPHLQSKLDGVLGLDSSVSCEAALSKGTIQRTGQ